MYENGVISSVRDFYEQLLESDEAFGSFMNPGWKGGKSPIRSVSNSNPSFNQFHATHMTPGLQPQLDPRVPFGQTNRDATSPVRVPVQTGYSPRDPRVRQYDPYGYSSVAPAPFQAVVPQYITHPIQYSQLSPEYQPHQYVYAGLQPAALPPPPYISPRRQQASRSQPASRRRRSSLSSMSSDSDDAEEISARIMAASSEDPRELRSIIKSSRGRPNKSLRRHRTDGSPKVRVEKDSSFPRDRSVPCMLDEFSDVFRTDGSPYESIYKSRRKPERREHNSRRERVSREPRRPRSRQSREISVEEDDMEIPAAVDAETWFNPEQSSPEREDEPAAIPPPPSKKRSSKHSSDRRRRRSISEQPRRRPQQLTTTVAHAAAIVPVDPERPKPRNLNAAKRPKQKDLIGDKVQTWWNPASIVTGKRQRLPVLDWRKGERYNRAPDGTVIGKEGFAKLVFDDNVGRKKGKRRDSYTRLSEEPTTAASEEEYTKKEKKRSRRKTPEPAAASSSSVVIDDNPPPIAVPESMLPNNNLPALTDTSTQRPLLNGWDYMHKNADGVFCLDRFQIIHRREDRKWSVENTEGGFIMSPSINCDSGFVAEMCLLPGMPTAPMETLGGDQALFLQVLRAAPSSIRVHVNGSEERLSPDDIMFIDCGSSYSITNVSRDQRAVLSFAYVQNKD